MGFFRGRPRLRRGGPFPDASGRVKMLIAGAHETLKKLTEK